MGGVEPFPTTRLSTAQQQRGRTHWPCCQRRIRCRCGCVLYREIAEEVADAVLACYRLCPTGSPIYDCPRCHLALPLWYVNGKWHYPANEGCTLDKH
jgi:hypothetical protein